MKAVDELGINKIVKFGFFSLFQLIYPLLFIPPLKHISLVILGAKIDDNSVLMNVKFFNLHHTGFPGLVIGKRCFLGDETLIDLYDKVSLGDDVTLAQRVTILTHINVGFKDHPLQKYFPSMHKPVIIKKGSVICASSTIIAGVKIGECSLIAAGSVVTHDVPPFTMVAGVPAKFVKKLK